jgi:hypothetical protein
VYQLQPVPDPFEGPDLPDWRPPGHPILAGLAAIALAVAAWHGLLWRSQHSAVLDDSTARLTTPVEEPAVTPDSALAIVPVTESTASARPPDAPDTTAPAAEPERAGSPAAPASVTLDPGLSPFRRSHPWAAVPGQPYYYPSRCPATLRFPDLVFFRTQAAARAGGFVPAPDSGCG